MDEDLGQFGLNQESVEVAGGNHLQVITSLIYVAVILGECQRGSAGMEVFNDIQCYQR